MRLLLGALAGALLSSLATAQETPTDAAPVPVMQEPGAMRLDWQIGYYDHGDDLDGNPFLDEDLQVIEPAILWDHQVDDDWGYSLKLSYDKVTSASIERLSMFPAQSGASGDNYVSLEYASRHTLEDGSLWGWNSHFSFEYDYLSLGLGTSYTTESEGGTAATTWGLNGFYDVLDVIRWNGDDSEGTDDRISLTANWSHSRLLSPMWNGEISAVLTGQSGFLETPYNFVVVDDGGTDVFDNGFVGTGVTEEVPDQRLRGAVSLRARRYLSEGHAFELGGRLYSDDWGISSIAFEPRYYWQVNDDWKLRMRYRYYTQTEADFFVDGPLAAVPGASVERTQDSDLGAFDAHLFGLRVDWQASPRMRWFVDFNNVLREDGLDYMFASFGSSISF
jgi:hypothetical protein